MADSSLSSIPKHKPLSYEQAFAMNGNQVPPSADEVEECILGALLLSEDALANSIDRLRVEHFYNIQHQEIFSAIRDLAQNSEAVDIITVSEKLKKRGTLDKVGGSYKLSTLTSHITSTAHLEFYINILAEKYIQREIIRLSTETLTYAYDETTDIIDLLDKTETKFLEINDNNFNSSAKSISSLLNDAMLSFEEIRKSDTRTTGIESGFGELDNIINGFQPGTLSILAARPAMGKTAFALAIARNVAVDFRKPIAIFSLEMTALELTNRLIQSEVGIDGKELKRGDQLTDEKIQMIREKTRALADAPMFIDDNPGLTIFELKAKCKRLKQQHNIQMILIDYLQLMSGDASRNNGNREQEISTISRELKKLSKELSIPVLALSQLSRAVETRGGSKEPVLSDLRESGAIEQDADIVMFIYRPEYYGITEDTEGSTNGIAYINVAKNRAGEVNKARLGFKHELVKFHNLDVFTSPSQFNDMQNNAFDSGFTDFESKINNSSFDDAMRSPDSINDTDSPF